MNSNLDGNYILISSENEIERFIDANEKTLEILNSITPQLHKHFPDNEFSLEISDKLTWTSECKLLVNVNVTEEIFFLMEC